MSEKEIIIEGAGSIEDSLNEFASYGEKYKLILSSFEKADKLLEELVKARQVNEFSQRDFADLVGIKQPQLARYEKKEQMPRIDMIIRLAEALDLEVVLEDKIKKESQIDFGTYCGGKTVLTTKYNTKAWGC